MTAELTAGLDFRRPEYRREVFLRFYRFHLRHRSHPGGVYYLMPWLAERYGWSAEQRLWFAFLNGHTQNPVTSLMLFRRGPSLERADEMLVWYRENVGRLAWDTDRRYHRQALAQGVAGLREALDGDPLTGYWMDAAERGWGEVWRRARALPTFGRLSAFSFSEYLRIMGVPVECDDLMLGDIDGSRSHRNGLCIVLGLDDLDWRGGEHRFTPERIEQLTAEASGLLAEAWERERGEVWADDVGYFTMESALCTYKSWHRPNRRYPSVYNDMLYDRIRAAERAWPDEDFDVFWEARAEVLPEVLRLEDRPLDPGVAPAKQNHYLETGEVIVMDCDDPVFTNRFSGWVESGAFGRRPS